MNTLHIRSALERDLDRVTQDLLRLGSMVEQAIERSVRALKERNAGLAQQVIHDDAQINTLRYKNVLSCLYRISKTEG